MTVPSSPRRAGDQPMIILIRHAEKPLHATGSPRGVDPDGRQDPHSLTVTGWVRAGALVELFAPAHGVLRAGLGRPDAIYGSAHGGGRSKRSIQTVSPLAARLGLAVVTRFAPGQEHDLAREITGRPGVTLVAWHHESIHEIAHRIGRVEPAPPDHWPHDRFDVIWTLTAERGGWRFAQVPQLLLPGDLPHPITALRGAS